MATDLIPAELLSCVIGDARQKKKEKLIFRFADGREANCWRYPMGEKSLSRGEVLVIDADA
jgi:hypothetical protein